VTGWSAYVLAGGKSTRFGSDKALAELDGEPLILRLARAVAPVARELIVVAERADKYASLGLPTIGDVLPDRGPLGGLLTALEHAPTPAQILLVTCDLVVFEASWVETLATSAEGARAVAFRDDRWQPFPGLYHTELGGDARRAVARGELGMGRFLDTVSARAVPLPRDWPPLVQANTRADLARFRA
jgi:molybdopterin-guanine dinucleotide biosynthesis protein A